MKDRVYVMDVLWFPQSLVWVLDGLEFSSGQAMSYLRGCGFSGIEALQYMRELRREAQI